MLNTTSIYSIELSELKSFLKKHNEKEVHATNFFKKTYKEFSPDISEYSTKADNLIKTHFNTELPKIDKIQKAEDKTVKFLVELKDGLKVETVLIPFNKKYTICLSSQVGCAMNCSFCFTGTQGLTRNLDVDEIIGQYILAFQWLKENRNPKSPAPNIVFMGQGEPLHNFEPVKKAIQIFLTTEGLHLGPRQITLSTAGFLPGLERFNEMPSINLALSLHSAKNDIRNELIPLNKRFDLEKIFKALDKVKLLKRQFINFEYLLIKDLNDSEQDFQDLVNLLKERKAIVNIIPFNEFPGAKYKRPSVENIEKLKALLTLNKIPAMIRTTKGDEILAACGQLKVLDI